MLDYILKIRQVKQPPAHMLSFIVTWVTSSYKASELPLLFTRHAALACASVREKHHTTNSIAYLVSHCLHSPLHHVRQHHPHHSITGPSQSVHTLAQARTSQALTRVSCTPDPSQCRQAKEDRIIIRQMPHLG